MIITYHYINIRNGLLQPFDWIIFSGSVLPESHLHFLIFTTAILVIPKELRLLKGNALHIIRDLACGRHACLYKIQQQIISEGLGSHCALY